MVALQAGVTVSVSIVGLLGSRGGGATVCSGLEPSLLADGVVSRGFESHRAHKVSSVGGVPSPLYQALWSLLWLNWCPWFASYCVHHCYLRSKKKKTTFTFECSFFFFLISLFNVHHTLQGTGAQLMA